MRRIVRFGSVIVLVITGVFAGRAVQGQSAQPAPSLVEGRQDMNTALLTEVRALRVAIEQMATAGARVQLIMGRLQMQEQRVGDGVKRLDVVRLQLRAAEDNLARHQGELKRMENSSPSDPEQRRDLEGMINALKREVGNADVQVQRLRTDESDAMNIVTAEQGRWADINQQLDELERILRKPPQ